MDKMIANIVFTKNRPLQLEGYLRSLYRHFPAELIQTTVVYKPEKFGEEYDSVFRLYPDVRVIREENFHRDVMGVLEGTSAKYILWGIDDVVFFDSVDWGVIDGTFKQAGREIFGFTLRFSPESLKDGPDEIVNVTAGGQTVYKLDWTKGQTAHTKYPFELCCTFYRADFVREIFRGFMSGNLPAKQLFCPGSLLIRLAWSLGMGRSILKKLGFFYSPNNLESWPCRWCQKNSDSMPRFTYFQKLCASAIQVNMVNTTTSNTISGTGEHTVEVLNEKFRQGYRLDIDYPAENVPAGPGCGKECFRLVRK